MMPTGNNEDYTAKKARTEMDGSVSASDRNVSKIPSGHDMTRITSILYMSQLIAGGMIGLMQQVGLLKVEINEMKKEMMTWANHTINRMFSWALHYRCLKGNFNRCYRVNLARGIADHSVDRVLHSFAKHKDFNRAFDDVTTALEVNCMEPSGIMKITHTTLSRTIDLPFFILSKAMLTDLKVPVVSLDWLKNVVKDREVDLGDESTIKIRNWVASLKSKNQFLPATNAKTGHTSETRFTPYVTSPCTEDGNVVKGNESMLCVDNANGNENFCLAANMLQYLGAFFHSSNIDNEARNLVPALMKHASKVCDFEPMFGMAPVLNVKFFLGLFFTSVELKNLFPESIFNEAIRNMPCTGMISRVEKPPEVGIAHTSYGIHIGVALILAAIMGEDMPSSPECTTFMATMVMKELLLRTPSSMLHPSGTDLVLRGFGGKNLNMCELRVETRGDKIASSFFLRQRNDTSFANKYPVMSMLDSPARPYMLEDVVHVQWLPFLEKNYPQMLQAWNKKCSSVGTDILSRHVDFNSSIKKIGLSDLYRTLDTNLIPCDDTLLYNVHYPVIGAGTSHTAKGGGWAKVFGYVVMKSPATSEIRLFKTDDESVVWMDRNGHEQVTGDTGHNDEHWVVNTVDVFDKLRTYRLLIQPLIARPGAVLYDDTLNRYGVLDFNISTGQCYNATTGKYTLRVPQMAGQASVDDPECDGDVLLYSRDPLEVEAALLGVPTIVYADSRGFVGSDEESDHRLPVGSASNTYIKGLLWYPQNEHEYELDHAYILVSTGSHRFELMSCNVAFLVHPDDLDERFRIVQTIRSA
jgi:hypothetical protein